MPEANEKPIAKENLTDSPTKRSDDFIKEEHQIMNSVFTLGVTVGSYGAGILAANNWAGGLMAEELFIAAAGIGSLLITESLVKELRDRNNEPKS